MTDLKAPVNTERLGSRRLLRQAYRRIAITLLRFRSWIKWWPPRFWRWAFVRPRVLWMQSAIISSLTLALPLAARVSPMPLDMPDAMRASGGVLQLVGLVTVALGFLRIRAAFNLPPVRDRVVMWFKAFPTRRGRVFSVKAKSVSATSGVGKPVVSTVKARQKDDLSGRIADLEANVKQLRKNLGTAKSELRKADNDLHGRVDRYHRQGTARIQAVETQLKDTAVGGLHLEGFGLACLLVGVALATWPVEIATLMS